MRHLPPLVLAVLLMAGTAWSQDEAPVPVDEFFDRTGDGIVDAADWGMMSRKEKEAYADASIRELGEDPYARLDDGSTRAQQYLQGLASVYE